jgi:hypothetical protein
VLPRTVAFTAAALLVLASAAQARDHVLELPAHVIVETSPAPGPNDPNRCLGASFVEFPEIKNAKGYHVVATDVKYGQGRQERFGPPFPADHHKYGWRTGTLQQASVACPTRRPRPARAARRRSSGSRVSGGSTRHGEHDPEVQEVLEHPKSAPPPPKEWIVQYNHENGTRMCRGWAPRG